MKKLILSLIISLLFIQPVFCGWDADGTDDVIDITATTEYGNSDMSISFWYALDAYEQYDMVFYQNVSFLVSMGAAGNTGGVAVLFNDSGGQRQNITSTYDWSGTLSHYLITFNAATNAILIYVNGVSQTLGATAGWEGAWGGTSNVIRIGGITAGAPAGGYTNGKYTEYALWTSVLTQADATQLATSKIKGMPLQISSSTRVMYLPMDDKETGTSADADIFNDITGNGFNGTGSDGANNTGCAWTGESVLSYPPKPIQSN